MNKNKKWLGYITNILLTLGLITGCSVDLSGEHQTKETQPEIEVVEESEEESVEVLIGIYIDDTEQEEFTHLFAVEEGTTLLELMEEHYRLVEEDEFVTCIEGNGQDESEGRFWVFDVNGQMGEVGAADYEIQDEDVIEWKLMSFE